jgi:hypothetical protein
LTKHDYTTGTAAEILLLWETVETESGSAGAARELLMVVAFTREAPRFDTL